MFSPYAPLLKKKKLKMQTKKEMKKELSIKANCAPVKYTDPTQFEKILR